MICRICESNSDFFARAKILNKYEVSYFRCVTCGFVQTEDPYWLEESYRKPIDISDTGVLIRNISMSKIVSTLLYFLFDRKGSYLDFAGGYGVFTRLMRDTGFDFNWHDPYSTNIFARGFEYSERIKRVELITACECFEHFVKPIEEIENMLRISRNIFFTTEIFPTSNPKPGEWWYYGLSHGQHVSFYSRRSLEYIAVRFELWLLSSGSVHLLTDRYINKFYFAFLVKLAKYITPLIVSTSMKSKSFSDNELFTRQ